MNKLTKNVFAAIAAAVMTVTSVSPSVYADFSSDALVDGWVKDGDTERRYINGLPYTGWLNIEDSTAKKYCLDGYLVTGNFTIGGVTYSFGENGITSGKNTIPTFSAECGEVNTDTSRIDFTVYANKDDGKQYSVAEPEKMERWVKGKWVDCNDKNTMYAVDDIASYFSYDQSNKVRFFPQAYTNNNFKQGYYRVTFTAREADNAKASKKKFYAVFKVNSGNSYKDGLVEEGTLTRRYNKGNPYTGWTQSKNGVKKYYLDGYPMTGELQMDNIIYTFDDEGNCITQSNVYVAADCGGKISAGTEKINVRVYSTVNSNAEYYTSAPDIKRWEYGRWTGWNETGFTPGYYRADLSAWHTSGSGRTESVSTMFEVVSYTVIKDGWVREGNVQRRYKSGRTYTGWVETKAGKKYCYDGYVVTGDFQIGKYIYSFTADGIYTGIRRRLAVTADCGNAVSSTAQTIEITVINSGADGMDYYLGMPYKMERWENGKWVVCAGDGVQYIVPAISEAVFAKSSKAKSNSAVMYFSPQAYTGYSFTPGYYRIAVHGWPKGASSDSRQDIYAMFQVV